MVNYMKAKRKIGKGYKNKKILLAAKKKIKKRGKMVRK
jgi:hypothetical protein